MGRAESARRERPSRRLEFRPRRPAGPAALASFFACGLPRRVRLAPALGLLWACLALPVLGALAVLPEAARAQTPTDCPTHAEWCETVTSGYDSSTLGTSTIEAFGFSASASFGSLSDAGFTHAGTDHTVTQIFVQKLTEPGGSISAHSLVLSTGAELPDGTVLNVNGTELTVGTASHRSTVGQEQWDLKTLGIELSWTLDQKVTVSLNFPPALESATVDGTELVLTYHEDLDPGSTPPARAYGVLLGDDNEHHDDDPVPVSNVSVSGKTVTLTLDEWVKYGEIVSLWYESIRISTPVQDLSGRDAPRINIPIPVTNNSPEIVVDLQELELQNDSGAALHLAPRFFPPSHYEGYPFWFERPVNFSRTVPHGTTVVTIFATPVEGGASVEFQRGDGTAIVDADPVAPGHQVALWGYANPVKIKVTNTVRTETDEKTYTLTIRVAGVSTQEAATGKPVINGTPRIGETLTMDLSGITDANGTYYAEIGWNQYEFRAYWLITDDTGVKGTGWTIESGSGPIRLNKAIYEGKKIYAIFYFKDDLGNTERLESDLTATVAGQQLIISGGGKITGSRCEYVFPAGPGCDGDASARDVGSPLEVASSSGVAVPLSEVTFSVASRSGLTRLDEFGNLQRANYEFEITSGGQLRTVAGKAYPHFEFPFCTRADPEARNPGRCNPGTITNWSLAEVSVKVTATWTRGSLVQRGTYWIPVWVTRHPDTVRVSDSSDLRCNDEQCYGRALAPAQTLYASDYTPASTRSGTGAPLSAAFEDVPDAHDGTNHFSLRLALTAAVTNTDADVREHAVEAEGGTVARAVRVDQRNDLWELTVVPGGTGDVTVSVKAGGTCGEPGVLCTAGGETLAETVSATIEGPGVPAPLTVKFEKVPESHNGEDNFRLDAVFSEAPAGMNNRDILAAVNVSGGTKVRVRTVGGDRAHRRIWITPDGRGAVTVSFPPTLDCNDTNAICSDSGGKLEGLAAIQIAGPAMVDSSVPLTVRFENVPEEHDGSAQFKLEAIFNHPPAGKNNLGILAALEVTNGTKKKSRRIDGDRAQRRIWVEPDGTGAVTLGFGATTDCAAANALCTWGGGKLESRVSVEIPGPVAISVADARADEAPDAELVFEVTLDRARHLPVSVDYETGDGTATGGEDYTAVSGTLTFAAGETSKRVAVGILDDAIDDGEETFVFRLSNPLGARIADGEATGTIENSDPLQKMWLSRFGRTVADHVTSAVSDRLANPLTGAQVTVGGQTVNLAETEAHAALNQALTGLARAMGASQAPSAGGGSDGSPGGVFGTGGAGPGRLSATADAGTPGRMPEGRELLLGSAFHLAAEGDGRAPGLAAWGRVTVGGFDGEAPADDGNVRIDGNVTTGILGADAAWRRLLAGVAVSVSEGEGTFDLPGIDKGSIESTMTTVSPYARMSLNDRLSVWGLAGWGTGDMTIVQDASDSQPERITRTDIAMRLAALGGRGALLQAGEDGGIDLALKADAFYVETESDPISNEGKTVADASRVRLALEGSRTFRIEGGAVLTPGLELGLRHDGGDAETGTGVELGGRVAWADAGSGLSVEASIRTLIAHEDSDYGEWGASGMLRLAPDATGRGLSFSLAPTWGAPSSAVERLWSARDTGGLASGREFAPERRLQGELGYGLALPGGFTGTPNVGFGLSDAARDWRIGWRLTPAGTASGFLLDLDATRREAAIDDGSKAEHGVMLRGALRW